MKQPPSEEPSPSHIVQENRAVSTRILDAPSLSLLSADRMRILQALGEEPAYPAAVARRLKMQVQTVYYHMRLLAQAGLVRFVELEEKGGATAKKFTAASPSFSVVVNPRAWHPYSHTKHAKPPAFLEPFVSGGVLDAQFVLGSPEPHGKYRGRGIELAAVELAMLVGNFAAMSYPLYLLDTELREREKRGNLIAVGGPKVNTLVAELNEHLPIYFEEKSFSIHSRLSRKTYEENVGVIELIDNPFNKSKKILLAAGTTHVATRVAVLALLKERERLSEGNHFSPTQFANVVQGFDEDGDGIVDTVEVLE